MNLDNLPVEKLLAEALRRIERRKIYSYLPFGHPDTLCPNGKVWKRRRDEGKWFEWSNDPWQLDFHQAGRYASERMLRCANRVGKTLSAAAEVAYHLTGDYPDWWEGHRFKHHILCWAGAITNETNRDIVQKELLGGTGESFGTGMIPGHLMKPPQMRQAGVSDVVDTVKVQHVNGKHSTLIFKTYDQGWLKWQGAAPDLVWLDEEPDDMKIFTEARTRLLTTRGRLIVTFTPLQGQTELVDHFQNATSTSIWMRTATWNDVPHLSPDDKRDILESYPDYEREARSQGVPMMGEGRIFTTTEDDVKVQPFTIPGAWARIKGIDFGVDHPATCADIAWDRDKDVLYVTRTWRKSGSDVTEHSSAIEDTTPWVPIAWPHDGTNREKSNGKMLKDHYIEKRLRMLSLSARYDNKKGGGQPVEPILVEVQKRMADGRFKVFATCTEFFDEMRTYHRKEGKIVAKRDDVLKAVFYGVMMRRFAISEFAARIRRAGPTSAYDKAIV